MNLEIKKADITDVEIISELAKLTFFETFSYEESKENMEKYLNESFSIQKLKTELESVNSAFFIAYLENIPAGYLKLNFDKTVKELESFKTLELQRIYLLESFQGKGVSNELMNKMLDIAKQQGFKYIWLGVSDKNLKAIKFYKKYGFEFFSEHVFMFGNEKQIDKLMKLEIL